MTDFVGPSYKLGDVQAACQRTVNMYVQRVGTPEKAQFILRAFPGFSATPFGETGDEPGGSGDPYETDVLALLPFDGDVLDYAPWRTVYSVNSGANINAATAKHATSSLDVTSDADAFIASSGNHLSPGPGDYTFEYWFFNAPSVTTANHFVLVNSSNGETTRVETSGSGVRFDAGGGLISSAFALPAVNAWYHIAFTKSGTTYKLWVDGEEVATMTGTGANLGTHLTTTCGLWVGGGSATGSSCRGRLQHFRFTKACRYTAAFSVPTAAFPVPPDLTPAPPEGRDYWWSRTGLLLLCNGANGATTFTDQSNAAHTVTNSGASLNTSVARLGSASINFTPASSYATVPHLANNNLESGDWTIELSVNMAVGTGNRVFLNKGAGTGNYQYQVWFDGTANKIGVRAIASGGSAAFAILSNVTATTGVWYDIMVRRVGYVVELYINGVIRGSASHIGSLFATTATVSVGAFNNGSVNCNSHIDCVRITQGIGRHPEPLTAEFKVNA